MTLVSLDIETRCGVGCEEKCEHALDEWRNEISVVGVVTDSGERRCFRDVTALGVFLGALGEFGLVGHALKFDLRTLAAKGLNLSGHWAHDTLLQAAVVVEKVSDEYLEWYARERERRNELLPRGYSHRPGSPHSLKVLAPYFLRVEPFWENPANHDNEEYVLKDCEYTLRLHYILTEKLKAEGHYDFYFTKLLPWTREVLLPAERAGIALDVAALEKAEAQAAADAAEARGKLDGLWAPAYDEWRNIQAAELRATYTEMTAKALAKIPEQCLKKDGTLDEKKTSRLPERRRNTKLRYMELYQAAEAKLPVFNLDSPSQLSWLLRDHFGLDIKDFDGDETTGKAVLERLAGEGRSDIREFLRYRKARKLAQAFFPSYRAMQWKGALHTSFNPTGTRTGRLSSSGPNLQQVEKGIHHLFVARDGYRLATYDMSAIEPRVILFYTHDLNLFDIVTQGKDFHNYNTAQFFDLNPEAEDFKKRYAKEREVGKEVGLALMYGAGTNRLMESAQKRGFVWSQREARYKLDRFREYYEGVFKFRDEVIGPALKAGHITNLLGRPVDIKDPSDIHMQGLNTLVQSSASDLVLNSAYRIQNKLGPLGARVLLLVHDEIVTEIPRLHEPECVSAICEAMTSYELRIPLGSIPLAVEGKVADSWCK